MRCGFAAMMLRFGGLAAMAGVPALGP